MELLTVVVIVVLLATMLWPVLHQAQQLARAWVCRDRVRQWTLSVWLYGEDHSERFPYEGSFMNPIDAGLNQEAWYNILTEYNGEFSLSELYARGEAPEPRRKSLFSCPAIFLELSRKPTVARPYFMYGFNNRMDPNGPARFRRAQVRLPDQTVVFTENSEGRFPSASGRYTPARHDGKANLGFADGHVEGVASNGYARVREEDADSEEEWSRPREVYWYPYPGAPP